MNIYINDEVGWHISCDENKKRCTIYEDKNEKFPIITLDIITEKSDLFSYGYVKLEKVGTFDTLIVRGPNEQVIRGTKVKLTAQRK